jgi:hypothetical protein
MGSAGLASLLSGFYVLAYNTLTLAVQLPCRFDEQRHLALPAVTRFVVEAELWWFVVPVVAVGLGVWLVRERKRTVVLALACLTWLFSFAWVLFAHLAWLLPLYPLCGPVKP